MKLRRNKFEVVGILETLWQMVGRYAPQGNIGKYTDEEIEAWIEWDGEEGALVSALVVCGWLDACELHRLLVHDWPEHADSATHVALAKQTLLFADGSVPYIPHEAFSGATRARIAAEYQKVHKVSPTTHRQPPKVGESGDTIGTDVPTPRLELGTMPEPEPEPEPNNPPTPQPAGVVAVGFDLQRCVDELYELMPPDKRSPNPSHDKSRIKYCLQGCGMSPPAEHFAAVKAGVLRLNRCLEAGYDRKFIPGFRSFFELGDDAGWRGEWLPPSTSESPPVAGSKLVAVAGEMLFGPNGEEVYTDAGLVDAQLASGWSRERPRRKAPPSAGALALAQDIINPFATPT